MSHGSIAICRVDFAAFEEQGSYRFAITLFTMTSTNKDNGALDVWTKDGVKFGKELREKEFMFQEGYLNLNHGEY